MAKWTMKNTRLHVFIHKYNCGAAQKKKNCCGFIWSRSNSVWSVVVVSDRFICIRIFPHTTSMSMWYLSIWTWVRIDTAQNTSTHFRRVWTHFQYTVSYKSGLMKLFHEVRVCMYCTHPKCPQKKMPHGRRPCTCRGPMAYAARLRILVHAT